MKWPWTKHSQTPVQSVMIDDYESSFLGCALNHEKITPRKAFDFYQKNSSVATAVDIIAGSFEQINPVIELDDGNILDKSPILDLLRYPNSYMGWSDFAGKMSRNYLLTSQSPIYGMGANNVPPTEIHPIRPTYLNATTKGEYVSIFDINDGVAKGKYKEELVKMMSRYYDGPLRELYRISGYSSMNTDASADSPLQAAALETNQQISGRIHNTKVLENGGRLSLLVIFKDEVLLGDEEHKLRTQRINETFAGANKAGKIGVMSGGDIQSVTEMAKSSKDLDYAKLDEQAGQAIYFRYKIPLPLVTVKASSFNNMSTGVEMLYDLAVLPHADKMFAGLSRFLLPRFGINPNQMRITYNRDSLQALKARRLDELQKKVTIGLETHNELRENIPYRGPIKDGDVVYQASNLVPIGTEQSVAGTDSLNRE